MKKLLFLISIALILYGCATEKVLQRNERVTQKFIGKYKGSTPPKQTNPNNFILIPSGYSDDKSLMWNKIIKTR